MLKMKSSPAKLLLAGLLLGVMVAPEVMAAPQAAPGSPAASTTLAAATAASVENAPLSSSTCQVYYRRRVRRRATYVRYHGQNYRAHYVGSRIVRRNGRLYRIRYYRRY